VQGWQIEYQSTNSNFLNNDQFQPPFWWKKIYDDPHFKKRVSSRWEALRGTHFSLQRINTFIDSIAAHINEAQQRNFVKWPILGTYVWPNAYVGGTYANEVAYLKMWIMYRLDWMDMQLVGRPLSIAASESAAPSELKLEQNYPNPFNPSTTISFSVAATASPGNAGEVVNAGQNGEKVNLSVYSLLGQEVATLFDGIAAPGTTYHTTFNATDLPSGVYFARLKSGANFRMRSMILLK